MEKEWLVDNKERKNTVGLNMKAETNDYFHNLLLLTEKCQSWLPGAEVEVFLSFNVKIF